MDALTVKGALSYGWNTFKARPWIFVQAGLLLLLVNIAVNLVQTGVEEGGALGGDALAAVAALIAAIIGIAVSFLVSMGETAFFLRAHDAVQEVSLKDLWHPQPFLKFAAVSILSGLAIVAGFILLIVPGVILAILFMFVGYLVIDEGLGPIEAMKRSIALTKGSRMTLFLLALAGLGVNLLGLLALVVGLLVTIPVTFLASAHAYRTLRNAQLPVVQEPEAAA